MAEETDQEAEARRQLEEYQRQQAAAALEASRNQPNAIPAEPAQPVRAADYASRGLVPTVDAGTPGASSVAPEGAPFVSIQGSAIPPQEQAFWDANPNGAVKDPQTGMLIGLGSAQAPRQEAQPALDFYKNVGQATMGQSPMQARTPQQFTVNDFINPQISARMGQLEHERSIIARNLNSLSPVSPGRGQKSQRGLELDKLKVVDHAYGVLQREQHHQSNLAFKTTTENQKLQQDTERVNAGTEIARWINTLPRDPAARQQAWQQELANRPDWLDAINHHDGVREYTKEALKSHQTVAEQQAAIQAASVGKNVQLTGAEGDKGRFKVTDPNAVPTAVKTRYDKVQANILRHTEESASEAKKQKLPDQPYSKAPDLHAFQSEAASLEQQYPGLKPKAEATPAPTPAAFDYSKIPSGSIYTDPNGVRRRKP